MRCHILSLDIMSLSMSSSANACKPANKQTSIFSYFTSSCNGSKRKRRNLEAPSTNDRNIADRAAVDEENVAVQNVMDGCEFSQANDDTNECRLKDSTRLKAKVDGSPVSPTSSRQSDSDSFDVVPPSPPTAAGNVSLTTVYTGRTRRSVRIADCLSEADSLAAAILPEAVSDGKSFGCEQKDQQHTRDIDTSYSETADLCNFNEREHDQCDKLPSVDVPSPIPAAVGTELCSSKSPATDAPLGGTPHNLRSVRRHFMEKVINVLLNNKDN